MQLECLDNAMEKHFEAKHTMMGESGNLKKSIVIFNKNFMEKFGDHVRAGHETLSRNCRGTELATSKDSGFTSGEGQREGSTTRRMLMGIY